MALSPCQSLGLLNPSLMVEDPASQSTLIPQRILTADVGGAASADSRGRVPKIPRQLLRSSLAAGASKRYVNLY